MPKNTKTLEETLTDMGVEGWFLWRPNQVYIKDPNDSSRYIPTDVVIDRRIDDIISAVEEERDRQIQAMEAAGESVISEMSQRVDEYTSVKQICSDALLALRNYFSAEDIPVAVAILDNALAELDNL